jgi:hypothetical protein
MFSPEWSFPVAELRVRAATVAGGTASPIRLRYPEPFHPPKTPSTGPVVTQLNESGIR